MIIRTNYLISPSLLLTLQSTFCHDLSDSTVVSAPPDSLGSVFLAEGTHIEWVGPDQLSLGDQEHTGLVAAGLE